MSAKLLTDFNGKPNKTSIRCWNLKVDGELDFSNAGETQTLSVPVNFVVPGGEVKFTININVTMTKIGDVVICNYERFSATNTSGENFLGTAIISLGGFDASYFPGNLVTKGDITAYTIPGEGHLALLMGYIKPSGSTIHITRLNILMEVPDGDIVTILGKTLIWKV